MLPKSLTVYQIVAKMRKADVELGKDQMHFSAAQELPILIWLDKRHFLP
jgi:hypothetical protein